MSEKPTYEELEQRIKELETEAFKLKQTEEALRESEEQYRHLYKNTPVMLHSIDSQGRLLSVSNLWLEAMGYKEDEVIGLKSTEFLTEASKKYATDVVLPDFFKNGYCTEVPYQFVKKNGETIDVLLSAISEKDDSGKVIRSLAVLVDVTERKRAEKALRESEEKYKQLTEQLSDVILTVKLGGRLSYLSPAIKGFGGYSPEEEVGNHIAKYFVDKKDLIKALKLIKKIYIDKKPASIEFLFKPMDRDPFYVEVTGRPLIIENKVQSIHCVMRNITNRKQAEEALKASEDRLKSFYDAAFEGIAVTEKGRLTDFNRQFAELFGYERNELIDREVMDLVAEEDRDLVLKNIRSGFDKPYEHKALHKDGSIMFIEVHGQNIQFKGRPARMTAVHDLTKRIRAEKSLKESEEKYRMLFNSINDAVFVHQPRADGKFRKFMEVNDIACRMYGYTREELLELTPSDLAIPERKEDAHLRVRQLFSDRHSVFEIVHKTRDGKEIPVEISAHLFNFHGQPTVLSVVRDITDRKQAEEERIALESQLQQAQKMESIGTLAGGIAHDFNNVLYSIIGYTELTMDDVPEGSVAQKNLKEVFKGAMRAKDMVQQILAFSRKAETIKKPIKIQSVVREAIKLLRTSIPSTIEIRQNIDANCSPVFADSTQIHQVVMNLSTNAYQAMREKGGVLELALMEEEISSDDSNLNLMPGKYLKLIVSDTGYGMDRVIIDKIFDPYFTTRGPGEGIGMGLAVVHGIVKSHGGDIKVYSEFGKGTIFHVYFPLAETIPVEPTVIYAEPAPRGTERILFVDDEEPIVLMAHQILERLGYQITPRTSSVEALEVFRAKPDAFDLVITDMTMPNMTGLELASMLREIRPDIPIIICTGFSEMIDGDIAESMGILGYVMKPIAKDEIARTIRKVLDKGPQI